MLLMELHKILTLLIILQQKYSGDRAMLELAHLGLQH